MPARLLFIEFEPDVHPGRLGEGMEQLGARVDVVHMHRGEGLPSLDLYEGLIPLGGAMCACDDAGHPYLKDVIALLQEAVQRDLPTMGVCLGGQLLARALGARVWRKPSKEIGYFPIRITPTGRADPLFSGFDGDMLAFQWHEDAFDLPEGATLLADSPRDSIQAFRYRSGYGLQFHPEVTVDTVSQWVTWNTGSLAAAAKPTDRESLVRRSREVDPAFAAQTKRLCENWMAIVDQTAAARR